MSTIADVARRAGVSKATVSRALSGRGEVSEATREHVRAVAEELGYVAHASARSLATGRTQSIGVVIPTLQRWFFTEVLKGIQEELFERDLDLVLYDFPEGSSQREKLFTHTLVTKRFDGVIAASIEHSRDELQRLRALGRPLVNIGSYSDTTTNSVSIDDLGAGLVATEHLLQLGHRDIVFLGGRRDAAEYAISDSERLRGYESAMTAAGLVARIRHIASDPSMQGAYAAAATILGNRRERPTAIVGVNDEAAIGAIIASRRLGIAVPTAMSIVGVDDHELAEMFALTTVRQQPHRHGRDAVRLLCNSIANPDAPATRLVEASELVVRASTAAPQSGAPAL